MICLVLSSSAISFGDDPTAGVYVRDSAVAVEKFALADRMQRLGEWTKAADVYQDLLQSDADRVVLSPTNPLQYQSVIAAVQDRLCQWPPEGLEIYRGRFETEAAGLLEQALAENRPDSMDDVGLLHRIFANYFVTDAAKTAGIRLMDTSIERGEFAAAAWIGRRLLDSHPMLLDDRPRILFREGIAHHLTGDDADAAAQLAELQQKYPTALGKVRGADAVLRDALADALKQPVESIIAGNSENWPMPFGSEDRARLPAASELSGARLFTIALDTSLPHSAGIPSPARTELKADADRDRTAGLTAGILPVIDRGELFFQDNVHVYAVSLESGLPLPGWQQTNSSEKNAGYSISGSGCTMPRCAQESVCVTDDSVLAVMGQPDSDVVNLTGQFMRDSRLVCLDRQTGHERWVCTPLRLPAQPTALRQLDFGGSPLVVGNNVYLIARGGQGMQFEDCYVVCLDVHTGDFKWASYLASANNAAQMWEMDVAADSGQNISHIAYSGGRLYVATNVGAVAAIDAYSGTVIWLNMYPRNDDRPDQLLGANIWARTRQAAPDGGDKPWTYNPVIVRDGKVFVMPGDGKFLHVYDAGSGKQLQQISLGMRASSDGSTPLETVNTLVGVGGDHGQWVVLASDRSVFCIDWKNYDPNNGANNLRWAAPFSMSKFPDDSIRGRPFMTADSVFVPLAWELARLELRTGRTLAAFPASGTWDESDDGPGNLLVTQDHLIIAGADHVNVYTDIAVAMRKLDAAVAAAPNDPAQRLRYAEILSAAGRYDGPDGAASKLGQAAALLGINSGATSPIAPTTTAPSVASTVVTVDPSTTLPRSRLFADALAFAQKIQHANQDPSGTMIDGMYDRAAEAALTPLDWVTYRLQRAAHLHQKTDSAGELALYQQILDDPELRGVMVPNGDNPATPAESLARASIADLIRRCGPAIYASYEQQAKDAVAAAMALPDPQKAPQLVAVAEMYPNSVAATGATLAAADTYESSGSPRESAALMRQFCSRYPDSPDRLRAIESLARAYLEMPNRVDGLDVAIGRLQQAAKLAGQQRLSRPLPLPDGTQLQNVTFAQAAESLRNFQAQIATNALPDPCIPSAVRRERGGRRAEALPDDPTATISDVEGLILPLHDWARHDRIVTFSSSAGVGQGLSVYAVGTNRPLFSCPAVTQMPRNVAWIGGNLLVWCPSHLLLIRGDGLEGNTAPATAPSIAAGAVIWDSPLHTLPAAQLASIGNADDDTAAATGDDTDPNAQPPGVVNINGQRIIVGGGRVFIAPGGRLQIIGGRIPINMLARRGGVQVGGVININPLNGQINPNGANPNGVDPNGENIPEQIDRIVPTADRLVFSTTGGGANCRIVSLNLADGHVQWQTSLEDHQIEQLAANDDFVVVRATNDSDVRLIAFDALTGQPVWHPHSFAKDNNDVSEVPVNMCLAEDGALVYMMPDRICCKDLFDPDPKLRFDRPISRNNNINGFPNGGLPLATFAGAKSADQLLVSDGRIMALSDNGMFVRLYSLADGTPYSRGPDAVPMLNTEVTNSPWNVHLRVVGTKLYIFGPDKVLHYDLENEDDNWHEPIDTSDSGGTNVAVGIRDLLVTRQDVLLLLEPATTQHRDPSSPYAPTVFLRPYSRATLPNGHETALRNIFDRIVTDPSGIVQFQVVNGGIYYAAGDHQLHFLKGTPAGAAK